MRTRNGKTYRRKSEAETRACWETSPPRSVRSRATFARMLAACVELGATIDEVHEADGQ
jgi:hypothetical protein